MKLKSLLLFIFISLAFVQCNSIHYRTEKITPPGEEVETEIKTIYIASKLKSILSFDLFRMAMIGFYNIDGAKLDKVVIVDFTKPSTTERCYIIDIEKKRLLYKCLMAHGVNSGGNIPSEFSNTPNSKQSSLGFFLIAETYEGKHGLSVRLDGVEKEINHNARERAIVIHGADYVSADFISQKGRLGRSWGCPALPLELSKEIIPIISNKRCLFIFGNNPDYLTDSNYILTKSKN